jgi:hypothetical protein
MKNNTLETPAKSVTKTIQSGRDHLDRCFVWTAYSDGSAMSEELTYHTGDPAMPVKRTWREHHAAGDDLAVAIHAM